MITDWLDGDPLSLIHSLELPHLSMEMETVDYHKALLCCKEEYIGYHVFADGPRRKDGLTVVVKGWNLLSAFIIVLILR